MERHQLQSISKIGGGNEGRCFCRALSFLPRPRSLDSDGRAAAERRSVEAWADARGRRRRGDGSCHSARAPLAPSSGHCSCRDGARPARTLASWPRCLQLLGRRGTEKVLGPGPSQAFAQMSVWLERLGCWKHHGGSGLTHVVRLPFVVAPVS